MLLNKIRIYYFFSATAKSIVLVCRLLGVALGGLSIKILGFASLTTNNVIKCCSPHIKLDKQTF